MSNPTTPSARIVVLSAGVGDPSSTRMLADRTADRILALAADRDLVVEAEVIELRTFATEIAAALVSTTVGPRLRAARESLAAADGIVVAAPVYKAAPSALLLALLQGLDNDLLIGKPVVLAATAGTPRHALVIDDQLRGLFAFLRTITVPTSLFAAPEDWSDPALAERIDRAAAEFVLLLESGVAAAIRDGSWHRYRHEFGSTGADAAPSLDFDSDLMRMARGGA